jgi:hypothetical protein
MKILTLLLASVLVLCAATTNRLFLVWDNSPDYDTNCSFQVYSTTNVALPVANWPMLSNISFVDFTNAAKPGEFGAFPISPPGNDYEYFAVTASNLTGISDFSDTVRTRRIQAEQRLRIGAY